MPSSTGADPLVSCIMPTADRRQFVPLAIRYFQAQDYPNKELLILDNGVESIADLVPADPRIRYLRDPRETSLGEKRNAVCAEARGEIIVHWDDDDWMASWRLRYQVGCLLERRAAVCGLRRIVFYDPVAARAWEYDYTDASRKWIHGATLCYTKAFWSTNRFPALTIGEDNRFLRNKPAASIVALDDNAFMVCLVHSGNTSPKQIGGGPWSAYPTRKVWSLMGRDRRFYGNIIYRNG